MQHAERGVLGLGGPRDDNSLYVLDPALEMLLKHLFGNDDDGGDGDDGTSRERRGGVGTLPSDRDNPDCSHYPFGRASDRSRIRFLVLRLGLIGNLKRGNRCLIKINSDGK